MYIYDYVKVFELYDHNEVNVLRAHRGQTFIGNLISFMYGSHLSICTCMCMCI
jgi:hypothetical protein